MKLTSFLALTTTACALLIAGTASAQSVKELREPTVRATCASIGSQFSRQPVAARTHLLLDCGDSGPAVLAALWSELNEADTTTLLALMQTAARLPDARLASVLLQRATDSTSPLEIRAGAIATLLVYFDVRLSPEVSPHVNGKGFDVGLRQRSHASYRAVSQPLSEDMRQDLRTRLLALNTPDAPAQFRYMLAQLRDSTPAR